MARILISDPQLEDRQLLELILARLGHEPIPVTMPTPAQLSSADLLLVEPVAPIGAVLALAARIARPSLPQICVGVRVAPPELADLGVVFAAALVKPLTSHELRAAIDDALLDRHGPPRSGA